MRLPEISKIHPSFNYIQNVKKSKTDVTDILSFFYYYTANAFCLKP